MDDSKAFYAFDRERKLFALMSTDQRLKVWDAESGALQVDYSSEQHLSENCTSFEWGQEPAAPSISVKKIKKSQLEPVDAAKLVAYGTDAGRIVLFNVKTGLVWKQLLGGHTESVTSLAFSADHQILYTGSNDDSICVWNVPAGTRIGFVHPHVLVTWS